MSRFDVRTSISNPITEITFSDRHPETAVALRIEKYNGCAEGIKIIDEGNEYVVVQRGNVDNLIKALNKAKELGWA